MRRAIAIMALVLASACNDDNETPYVPSDASTPDAAIDASTPADASVPGDATTPRSLLPRFGALERPPTALPDDLKPPR